MALLSEEVRPVDEIEQCEHAGEDEEELGVDVGELVAVPAALLGGAVVLVVDLEWWNV